jgi:hypothetical protein
MKLRRLLLVIAGLASSALAESFDIVGTVTGADGSIAQVGAKWFGDLSTGASCQMCYGGDPTGITDLEMIVFGAFQDEASDDLGPTNVEFDRSDLTLSFADTVSDPSILIFGHRFELWWPYFGTDNLMAFGTVEISEAPEPATIELTLLTVLAFSLFFGGFGTH